MSDEIKSQIDAITQDGIRKARFLRLLGAGVPKRHARLASFGTIENDHYKGVLQKACLRMRSVASMDGLFVIVGNRGTGKTQFGASLICESLNQGRSAVYVTAMRFFMDVRDTFGNRGERESSVVDRLATPNLLVLDEIGRRSETPWENNLLVEVVDRRYSSELMTILISAHEMDDVTDSLGDSIVSRAKETGGIFQFKWASFRGHDES